MRFLIIALCCTCFSVSASTLYVNGHWWQNNAFVSQNWYVEDGVLRKEPTRDVTNVIDLTGKYVVHPYGEAHNHNLQEVFLAERFAQSYVENGVLFGMMMCANARGQAQAREFIDSTPLNIVFASACVSSSDGHPLRMALQPPFEGAPTPSPEDIYDKGFIVMDSVSDVEEKWPLVEAGEPDILKIILVHHEVESRRDNERYFGVNGLTEEATRELVELSRANNLRVVAHVESAADFELAVDAGVDIIGHVPGYHWWEGYDPELYAISESAAREAAARGVQVITTMSVVELFQYSDDRRKAIVELQAKNLATLYNAGVQIIVGSDRFDSDVIHEVEYLSNLNVLSAETLLNLLTVKTPRALFPQRDLGVFDDGYEANFLVLGGNPIKDFQSLRDIELRVMGGQPIKTERDSSH